MEGGSDSLSDRPEKKLKKAKGSTKEVAVNSWKDHEGVNYEVFICILKGS